MKKGKRIISVMIMCFIIITQNIYAEEVVTPESPSAWAIWDVQMSYVYGLGSVESYKGYTEKIQGNRFLEVESSFENKFNVLDETKVDENVTMTRGDIIKELYDVIVLSLKLEDSKDISEKNALEYFVENGLIQGRSNGDYALSKECTQQEMLIFSSRTYAYLVYALDLDAKGAFWKVSDEDNTVYLLGSIHMTDGSVYPMSKDIINAFIDSEALVVEANILVPNPEDTAYVQQKMMIEGEGTIDKLISKETYDAYVEAVKPLGMVPEVYNKFKPWAAATVIQTLQMSEGSYDASMGIDMYFLSMAYNYKPIIEIEGMKLQIDMFDSFTPELQEGYLEGVLEGEDTSNDMMTEMIANWRIGNVEELGNQVFAEEATTEIEKEFNEKLWNIRNGNMLDKVKKMLAEDSENDYFVVVGVGHMLNDNGLVQGLTDLGYDVEQVK